MKKDVKFYLRQLELADKEERKWRDRAKKIVKKYRDEDPSGPSRYNILWSNTQTQLPAMYSARPKPDVRRRWRTESKVGRDIAQAVERALEFSMDTYDFDRMAEKLTLDFLLPGRCVSRVRYHPVIVDKVVEEEIYDEEKGDFINRKTNFEEVIYEEVRCYHVPWKHYRQSPADCWADVWWVAYGDNFLSKEEIIEQFGQEHESVPLAFTDDAKEEEDKGDSIKRAQVWEMWDKEAKQVVAVVKGYDRFLLKEADPLKLQGFFPQPEPAAMIETPDSLIPIPEYTMYQFQAEELNTVTKRIASLAEAMQAKGFYPGEDAAKINELLKSSEAILVPVDNYAAFAEKGGVKGMIDWMPIKEIAEVWQRLLVQRNALSQSIFELIGISDIQRGATDPRETKGAQQLKASFGGRRLLPKQQRLQRFFRDILRLKAEIIAENFSAKTLSAMSGVEVTEEMLMIMRNDALRSFTIDIETDSTIAPDAELEKQGVAEFLASMSQYLGQVMPIVQAQPAAAEPLGKMLLWMTRKFKIARDVEQEIEDFIAAMGQQQQSETDGEQQKLEMEAQKVQAEQQLKEQEMQAEQSRKDRQVDAEIQRKNMMLQIEMREKGLSEAKIAKELSLLDAKVRKERGENVVPINAGFQVIRDENGEIAGAQVLNENGGTKTVRLQRQNGKVVGGQVES
jgi:hypothetical protein